MGLVAKLLTMASKARMSGCQSDIHGTVWGKDEDGGPRNSVSLAMGEPENLSERR